MTVFLLSAGGYQSSVYGVYAIKDDAEAHMLATMKMERERTEAFNARTGSNYDWHNAMICDQPTIEEWEVGRSDPTARYLYDQDGKEIVT